jgi:hypothetical protein
MEQFFHSLMGLGTSSYLAQLHKELSLVDPLPNIEPPKKRYWGIYGL